MNSVSDLYHYIKTDLKLAFSRGVFHLLLSLSFVQGSVFITQFIVARLLSPEEFGYVKVVDTALGMLLVLATVGMPSAVAKYIPEVKSEGIRGKILFQVLVMGAVGAFLISGLVFVGLEALPLSSTAVYYLKFLIWALIPTTLSRTIINYYQGRKQIQRMAGMNIALSILTLFLVAGLTALWKLNGWAVGKFVSEVVFVLGLFLMVRQDIVVGWQSSIARRLLSFGGFAALSLLVWRIQATADVLYLDVLSRNATQVGYYGMASLVMSGLLLIPAAVGAAAFPYMSERSTNIHDVFSLTVRILKSVALLMFGLCAVVFAVGPSALPVILRPEYAPAGILIRILMPATFIGSVLAILGNFFFAIEGAQFTLAVNLIAVLTSFSSNYFLIPRWGVVGTAWAMVITQVIQLALYTGIIFYLHRPGASCRRTVITID